MTEEEKSEWRESHGIKEYEVDPRLKVKTDYPEELLYLVRQFNLDPAAIPDPDLALTERTFREFFLKPSPRLQKQCIRRVNVGLQYLHPVLERHPVLGDFWIDYQLGPCDSSYYYEHSALGSYSLWLMKIFVGLDPKLVHRCPYCDGIFISRQKRKYHSPCKHKFLAQEAVRRGLAAKRQREYRGRLKLKKQS